MYQSDQEATRNFEIRRGEMCEEVKGREPVAVPVGGRFWRGRAR
jgi:hypothetical protein